MTRPWPRCGSLTNERAEALAALEKLGKEKVDALAALDRLGKERDAALKTIETLSDEKGCGTWRRWRSWATSAGQGAGDHVSTLSAEKAAALKAIADLEADREVVLERLEKIDSVSALLRSLWSQGWRRRTPVLSSASRKWAKSARRRWR